MRVALYTESFLPHVNGIVKVACLTLEHYHRRGVDSIVITPDHGLKEYAGAEIVGIPSIYNPIYPKGRVGIPTWNTYRRVKNFKPDLIHIFHPSVSGLIGLLFARQLGVPTISSFHLDISKVMDFYGGKAFGGLMKTVATWSFNQSDYALAPSALVQDEMKRQGVRKVGLWRRGVDAQLFHPRFRSTEMRQFLSDGHPESPLLLYVGRLAPEKQIHQLRAILEHIPGTRLALVGGGPDQPILERQFDGLPVKFAGYLKGEALSQAFASADLFVFPSSYETFGLVLLEAMASGLPVVSSRVGGAEAMIEEGVSGYTFAVNDTKGMVQAVQHILTSSNCLSTMSLAARQHAENQSWTPIMDELISTYEAVLYDSPLP